MVKPETCFQEVWLAQVQDSGDSSLSISYILSGWESYCLSAQDCSHLQKEKSTKNPCVLFHLTFETLRVKCGQLLWGEEWKADLYSEHTHQRTCSQMGSVTAGCHCSVGVGTQKRVPA